MPESEKITDRELVKLPEPHAMAMLRMAYGVGPVEAGFMLEEKRGKTMGDVIALDDLPDEDG